jgi:glyoxylate/succinic semialdehyde reductase
LHIAARFTTPRVLQSPRRPPEPRPLVPRARKMSAPPKVGFLGLGIMGAQMAARLVRSGAQVTVWNRSLAKTEPLKALGALVASTPREVTTSCDLVFAMLADPQAAMKVATEGPDAAVAGIAARPPTAAPITYVDCSTVDAATGEFVGNAVRAAMVAGAADPDKGGFLAAPVSGGWRDCRDGTLLFLCGGSRAAYDAACVPHGLDAMGHKRWLLGPNPGDAARAKLMLQVMMGNMVGSLAEMMALSKASGLDERAVLDVLSNSAMGNPLCTAKGKLMMEMKYEPNFQVYLQQKDLRLALQLADDLGVPAPISAAANAQYVRARQMCLANADFAAVRMAYEAEVPPDKESETGELN